MAGIVYYKRGQKLDRSDLTELCLSIQITSDGVVKEKHLWQEFCEVWNTFQIIYFSMHFKYYRVKLKGKIMSVDFRDFLFTII